MQVGNRFPIVKARFIRYCKDKEDDIVDVDIGIESRDIAFRNAIALCSVSNPVPQLEALLRPFYCVIKHWAYQRGLISTDFGQSCVYLHLAEKFLQMHRVNVTGETTGGKSSAFAWEDRPLIPTMVADWQRCQFPVMEGSQRPDLTRVLRVAMATLSTESAMQDGFDPRFYKQMIAKQVDGRGMTELCHRVSGLQSSLLKTHFRPPGLFWELLCAFFEMYGRFNFELLAIATDEYGLSVKPQEFEKDALFLKPTGGAGGGGTDARRSNMCPYFTAEALNTVRAEMHRAYLLCSIGDPNRELFEVVCTDKAGMGATMKETGITRAIFKALTHHMKPATVPTAYLKVKSKGAKKKGVSGGDGGGSSSRFEYVSRLPSIVDGPLLKQVRIVEEERGLSKEGECLLSCESPLCQWRITSDDSECKRQTGLTVAELADCLRMGGALSVYATTKDESSGGGDDSSSSVLLTWDVCNDVQPSWLAKRLSKQSIPVVYSEQASGAAAAAAELSSSDSSLSSSSSDAVMDIHPSFWEERPFAADSSPASMADPKKKRQRRRKRKSPSKSDAPCQCCCCCRDC